LSNKSKAEKGKAGAVRAEKSSKQTPCPKIDGGHALRLGKKTASPYCCKQRGYASNKGYYNNGDGTALNP